MFPRSRVEIGEKSGNQTAGQEKQIDPGRDVPPRGFRVPYVPKTFQQEGRGGGAGGTIMDMSEDCWEHVGLLQEVSAAEPPPPPPAPDFLIQQQEVSQSISFFLATTILTTLVVGLFDRLGSRSNEKKRGRSRSRSTCYSFCHSRRIERENTRA